MKVPGEHIHTEGFWDKVKAFFGNIFTWVGRYPIALIVTFLLLVAAVVALALGWGDRFNIGGLIGRLFGKKADPDNRVIVANKVPEQRVDEAGESIPVGEPDDKGIVQRPVEVLEQSANPFRDKSKIKVKTPEGVETQLDLPTGVEDNDVDRVFQIQPKVYTIEVKARPEGRVSSEDLSYLE